MRTGLSLLLALLLGNVWGIVSWQMPRPSPPHSDAALQCFAGKVLALTEPRAAVYFVLPSSEADGGLINHRLRYALPARYVSTNQDMFRSARRPDWIATWRGGCDGTLERAASR